MHKSLHIQGKVTPKISEEQAKITGKHKFMGQFLEKEFERIEEKFDKVFSRF